MCILLPLTGGAHTQQKAVRILAIGNSFSRDTVEQYPHEPTEVEGISTIIDNMLIGGYSLERHVKSVREGVLAYACRRIGTDRKKREKGKISLKTVLADKDWDYVSLQQASIFSGMYETYEASLSEPIEYVKTRPSKKTKLTLHQTWTYAPTSSHGGFKSYNRGQPMMHHVTVDAAERIGKAYRIKMIIPTGTAIQNARASFIGDRTNRDGHHPDVKVGRYAAACVWSERIFKHNVIGNPYALESLSEVRKTVAQEVAHAAAKYPYKVIGSSERR